MHNNVTLDIPADLQAALAKDETAMKIFLSMPPSHKREYVEFITEAKKPETRIRRIGLALAKIRDWHD